MGRFVTFVMIMLPIIGNTYEFGLNPVEDFVEEKPEYYEAHESHMAQIIKQNMDLVMNTTNDLGLVEGDPFNDIDNCEYIVSEKEPFELVTKDKSRNTVVQLNFFKQKIRSVKCLQANVTCFQEMLGGSDKIDTRCAEKYSSTSLYVYDLAEKKLRYEMFEVAVACVCQFKRKSY